MSETPPDNLFLEHLRGMREAQEIQAGRMQEITERLGAIETMCGDLLSFYASISNRIDRLDACLARIERRLGPADAPEAGE